MDNQLVNSMVRGFGMTLGRKAANSVTQQSAPRQLSAKKEKYYCQLLGFQEELATKEENVKKLYEENQITHLEYLSLKAQLGKNFDEIESEIKRLDELRKGPTTLAKVLGIIGWVLFISIIVAIAS
jgi:hypothetical protein